MSKKDTKKVFIKIVNILHNEGMTPVISSHFCYRLNLNSQVCELVSKIVSSAIKYNLTYRRSPRSVAAAAIYMACALMGGIREKKGLFFVCLCLYFCVVWYCKKKEDAKIEKGKEKKREREREREIERERERDRASCNL